MKDSQARFRIGVDVGGTFKNSVLWIFSVCADTKRQVVACLPYPIDITVNIYSRHNAN